MEGTMASSRATDFARTRCVECGHEFAISPRWGDTRACPACGHLASRSRDWLVRSAELLAVALLSFLFWAYWWF
jgi:uncharacterized paraquat-inducible protein A